jgi:hypothetical protein
LADVAPARFGHGIREMQNVIERAVILSPVSIISAKQILEAAGREQ